VTNIVIASGKGGTGKTLVATSLALAAAERGACALLDADVEEPNAALFLGVHVEVVADVVRKVPVVDQTKCTHCGICAQVCQFNAIAVLPNKTLVFEELCHGCGSCERQCPESAIREEGRKSGVIEGGRVDGLRFAQGVMEVGEAMSPPIIRDLKRYARERGWYDTGDVIMDAPPGTACPVVEALRGADCALLVTEPTPFGLHDLVLAVQVAREIWSLPVGVVVNKDRAGVTLIDEYCREEDLPIVMRIPLERRIAEAYSRGIPLLRAGLGYEQPFAELLARARSLARGERP